MALEDMIEPIVWIGIFVFGFMWLREEQKGGWKTIKGMIKR